MEFREGEGEGGGEGWVDFLNSVEGKGGEEGLKVGVGGKVMGIMPCYPMLCEIHYPQPPHLVLTLISCVAEVTDDDDDVGGDVRGGYKRERERESSLFLQQGDELVGGHE